MITFKTLLLAVALLLLTWAVVSIRDTLLVVFVGIFLGLKAGAAALPTLVCSGVRFSVTPRTVALLRCSACWQAVAARS